MQMRWKNWPATLLCAAGILLSCSRPSSGAEVPLTPRPGDGTGALDLVLDAGDQHARTLGDVRPGQKVDVQVLLNQAYADVSGFKVVLKFDPKQVSVVGWRKDGTAFAGAVDFPAETRADSVVYGASTFGEAVTATQGALAVLTFQAASDYSGDTEVVLESLAIRVSGAFDTLTPGASVVLRASVKTPSPDFDGDGEIGLEDFFMFAVAFGQPATGANEVFDLDGDGEVWFGDFFAFVNAYASAYVKTRVIWATDHETGDLSDWYRGHGGGVFNSGTGRVSVTTEAAHTGRYSAKMEVWGIDQGVQACRLFRWGERLTEGYFSAWYMFPVLPQVNDWLTIFEFKKRAVLGSNVVISPLKKAALDSNAVADSTQSVPQDSIRREIIDPTWYNEVRTRPQGIILTLSHWNRAWNLPGNVQDAPLIGAGRWFHVEWYYRDGVEDGIIRVWIDGKPIWSLENVDTRGVDPYIQWAPVLYGTGVTPGHLVLYVDDAVISPRRIGPEVSLFFR